MTLSVIIPALNAAASLPATLAATLAALGGAGDVIVVDGGSTDATLAVAAAHGARTISAPRGRGSQLAAGVAGSRGAWLLLLHADTRLAAGWQTAAADLMQRSTATAGYFRFALDTPDPRARRLERIVAWRCRRFALPYGDQGLLIARSLLHDIGGIRPLPLMEDVDLVRRLGRNRLTALHADAVTSAAKWQRDGWRRRSARNLGCLALYFLGVPPHRIKKLYE